MPSTLHESLTQALLRTPDQLAELLKQTFNLSWPSYVRAHTNSTKFERWKNIEHFADGVLTYHDQDKSVVAAVLLETQLAPDPDKHDAWLFYLAALRREFRCPVFLVVVTPTVKMATWASQDLTYGHPGLNLRPLVIGPDQIPNPDLVVPTVHQNLDRAVLSALLHGNRIENLPLVVETLSVLSQSNDQLAKIYIDAILSSLPDLLRRKVFEMLKERNYEYSSEFARKYFGEGKDEGRQEGKAEGRAEGRQEDLILLLESRALVTPDAKVRILNEQDAVVLRKWFVHALTANSLDDVFNGSE